MPTVKLTARTVEAARPPATGRLELFDEGLPGFCIRITANDRRTACVFYRIGSRLRRATLGTLPPLSLADARDLAREALRQAALGHDPASAKREAREALTFAGLSRTTSRPARAGAAPPRTAITDARSWRLSRGRPSDSKLRPRRRVASCALSSKPSLARLRSGRIGCWRWSARRSAGAFGKN